MDTSVLLPEANNIALAFRMCISLSFHGFVLFLYLHKFTFTLFMYFLSFSDFWFKSVGMKWCKFRDR